MNTKFKEMLKEKIEKSDLKRISRITGSDSSKDTMNLMNRDPAQVIRKIFGAENVEKDIVDYINAEKKAGADLGEDTQLVLFIASLQDLISKINNKNKK